MDTPFLAFDYGRHSATQPPRRQAAFIAEMAE